MFNIGYAADTKNCVKIANKRFPPTSRVKLGLEAVEILKEVKAMKAKEAPETSNDDVIQPPTEEKILMVNLGGRKFTL